MTEDFESVLEWDADDPAGNENAYDGLAVETIPYTPDTFAVETDKLVIDLG